MTLIAAPRTSIPREAVDDRGSWAMWLFIASEATLFSCFFFSYYYLGHGNANWPPEAPKYGKALGLLVILLSSSAILRWGELADRRGEHAQAKLAVLGTVIFGLGFLALQAFEYRDHLQELQPSSSAYGSIFYTIESFHAAHLILGLLMLIYVLMLPLNQLGPAGKPPHHSLHNAALYWHFVDFVWIFIVIILYAIPQFQV